MVGLAQQFHLLQVWGKHFMRKTHPKQVMTDINQAQLIQSAKQRRNLMNSKNMVELNLDGMPMSQPEV